MTERERLIREIKTITKNATDLDCGFIADFIINDRKRICEPLVKWRKADPYTKEGKYPEDAISETLKLAGQKEG